MLAALALIVPAIPSSSATLGCVGYQACYQATGDGWAIVCVWPSALGTHCVDLVCESCGNIPVKGFDARSLPVVLP